jgi:hypothetical protein
VLKNLLSNAFKFTERGRVEVEISLAASGWDPQDEELSRSNCVLAFAVRDTGIGIPEEKQAIVFEAFQQAEGSTSRKYGGTGLGLAISLELAHLLGGDIKLESRPGEGSTFTLYLPRTHVPGKGPRRRTGERAIAIPKLPGASTVRATEGAAPEAVAVVQPVADDRRSVRGEDRVVLVVENDIAFSRFLMDMAHEKGFKAVVTAEGGAAVELAHRFRPHAVVLDLRLPDRDGWGILEQLKRGLGTRHIPVYVVSTEEECEQAPARGAVASLTKPVAQPQLEDLFDGIAALTARTERTCLLVQGNARERKETAALVGGAEVVIREVRTAREALQVLEAGPMDGAVLDLDLPDGPGLALASRVRRSERNGRIPIVLLGDRDLTAGETRKLETLGRRALTRHVRTPESLVDEASLFLHRPLERLTSAQRAILEGIYSPPAVLGGRTVLVVDDDVRNIFAMTALLERQGMRVLACENGRDAMSTLDSAPGIDIVLMDIMMPELDGYDTMKAIRKIRRFRELPIVALTAKAMKGDREKCIEAGASDYIAKPVDTERLLAMLCAWLLPKGRKD